MTGLPSEVYQRIGGGADAPRSEPSAASTLAQPEPWFSEWATGGVRAAGPVVNEWTAMLYGPLYSCVSLIASIIASLPCKVYRRRKDGGQDEVDDHPASGLFQREYNPNTSSMTGRETEIGHLLTWGNSFAQIVRSRAGDLLELRNLGPDVVGVGQNRKGELEYTVRVEPKDVVLPRDEVLHTPHLSFDALCGLSLVRLAKGVVRTGVAQDRQAERFVTKGLRAPGALQMRDGSKFKSTAEAVQFRDRWRAVHNKEDGDQEIMILEDGAKWQELGTDPESAQLLESRSFSIEEVARIYHVPPHRIGHVEKTTSFGSGVEEQNIVFLTDCLLPILRRYEQERNRKLFVAGRKADAGLFVEHSLDGLLRGDTLKRSQMLEIRLKNGVITVNEWRRLEGMNPTPGGNVRYFPLNTGRVDAITGEDIPPPEAATPPPDALPAGKPEPKPVPDGRLAAAFRRQMVAGLSRCLRKEGSEAVKAAAKPNFVGWIDGFYEKHAAMVGELFDTDLTAGFAARHVERSRNDLLEVAGVSKRDELVANVERAVERWQAERAADLVAELNGGIAHATV